MSDKDDNKKVTPDAENGQPGDAGKREEPGGLELDLTDAPEFLSLAADFDAAIRGEKFNGQDHPGMDDAEAEEPQSGSWIDEPENPVEPMAEPLESEEASSESEAVGEEPAEPDFVLVAKPRAGEESREEPAPPAQDGQAEPAIKPAAEGTEPHAEPEERAAETAPPAGPGDSKKKSGLFRGRSRKPRGTGKAGAAPKAPYLGVESTVAPTMLSRVFSSLSFGGILVLTAIFLVQLLPGLQTGRLLWFSDELRQADVLAGVFNGNWLQIQLNGQLYQEAPPLYFWFLVGLHKLLALAGLDLGKDYASLLYAGAAVSGLLLLWATYGLARSTAHLDRRGAFATGCVLLSVLFLQFFFHYSSLDLFFAAFIVASHIFMFKALMRSHAPLHMGLAFLCASVALMSKGALGLMLPVLSAVLFSLWRGKPKRLLKGDFLLGLVLAVLPAVIWLGSIWYAGQHGVVLQMLKEQIWVKAFGDAWHKGPWWYYLAVLPALWMPWSLIIVALPWHRVFSPEAWTNIKSARTGERQGLAFVWIFFLGAFVLISLIQHKQPVFVLPLVGPLAVLTGRAALQLSPLRSIVLQRLMALLFFLLAVTFVLLPVYYSGSIPPFFSWLENINIPAWEVKVNGIFLLAVITLGTTCLLIGLVKSRRPESTLLVLILSSTLFSCPLSTMTMPSLDNVLSPKAASIELRRYADLGYYPVSFRVYSGVFSYYSSMIVNETDAWAELDRMVAAQPKMVVAMSATRWEGWTHNPGFTEVMRFWMFSNEYVLLLRNAVQDEAPAPQPPLRFEPDPEPVLPEGEPPDESLPDKNLPEEEPLPGELLLEELASDMPTDVVSGGEPADEAPELDEPGKASAPESAPGAASDTDAVGEVAEQPAEEPAADDHPLPDGLPLTDAPDPGDPFAPFPDEQ